MPAPCCSPCRVFSPTSTIALLKALWPISVRKLDSKRFTTKIVWNVSAHSDWKKVTMSLTKLALQGESRNSHKKLSKGFLSVISGSERKLVSLSPSQSSLCCSWQHAELPASQPLVWLGHPAQPQAQWALEHCCWLRVPARSEEQALSYLFHLVDIIKYSSAG